MEFYCSLPCGVLTLVVALAIGWLTLSPSPAGDLDVPLFEGADKIIHEGMFFALSLAAGADMGKRYSGRKPVCAVCGFILAAAYGVLTEFLQDAMDYSRTFEIADIMADIAGGAAGAYFLLLVSQHELKKDGRKRYSGK